MRRLKDYLKQKFSKHMLASALAGALAISLGVYEFASPVRAASPAPAPAAAPLDDNSVGALLALDQAMENLASHVTPAVVNITVTAKHKPQFGQLQRRDDDDDDQSPDQNPMQQFGPFGFGPGPFRFGHGPNGSFALFGFL